MSEEQTAYQNAEPEAYVLLQDWPVLIGSGMLGLIPEGTVFKKAEGSAFYWQRESDFFVSKVIAESNPKWFKPQYDADSRPEIISNQRGI